MSHEMGNSLWAWTSDPWYPGACCNTKAWTENLLPRLEKFESWGRLSPEQQEEVLEAGFAQVRRRSGVGAGLSTYEALSACLSRWVSL